MPDTPEDRYPRLSAAISQRYRELIRQKVVRTWEDVAARSGDPGVSAETLRSIRHGRAGELRELTLIAVATALDWPLEHVLDLVDVPSIPPALDAAGDQVKEAFLRAFRETEGVTAEQVEEFARFYATGGGKEIAARYGLGKRRRKV